MMPTIGTPPQTNILNPKMKVWKMIFLFKGAIFQVPAVSFLGSMIWNSLQVNQLKSLRTAVILRAHGCFLDMGNECGCLLLLLLLIIIIIIIIIRFSFLLSSLSSGHPCQDSCCDTVVIPRFSARTNICWTPSVRPHHTAACSRWTRTSRPRCRW